MLTLSTLTQTQKRLRPQPSLHPQEDPALRTRPSPTPFICTCPELQSATSLVYNYLALSNLLFNLLRLNFFFSSSV